MSPGECQPPSVPPVQKDRRQEIACLAFMTDVSWFRSTPGQSHGVASLLMSPRRWASSGLGGGAAGGARLEGGEGVALDLAVGYLERAVDVRDSRVTAPIYTFDCDHRP